MIVYKCIKQYDKELIVGKYYYRYPKTDHKDYFIDEEGDKRYLFDGLDAPSHHFNAFFTKINFINYLNEIEK